MYGAVEADCGREIRHQLLEVGAEGHAWGRREEALSARSQGLRERETDREKDIYRESGWRSTGPTVGKERRQ